MPEAIRRLPRPEATRLRSSMVVPNLSRVLSELAQNALDANASRIDCWVNVTSGDTAIRVEDDGSGMDAGEMKEVGERYCEYWFASSKGSDTWVGNGTYGFRGEALASISALALVEITSRHSGGETTTKIMKNGQVLFLGTARHDLPRPHGTTVVVRELFNSIPVRQASLTTNALAGCRRVIETLALVAPRVRWTLREERIGGAKQILLILGGRNSCEVFRTLYGHAGVERVQSVRVSAGDRRVDGFISLEGGVTKAHQHLYVNGYPLYNSELHLLIARRFSDSSFSAMANDLTDDVLLPKKRPSPRRLERHPVYVLNITLPPNEVDAAYEPGKAMLGYKEPGQMRSFLTAVIDDFLRRQGFAPARPTPSQSRSRSQSPTPSTSRNSKGRESELRVEESLERGTPGQSRLGSVAEECEGDQSDDTHSPTVDTNSDLLDPKSVPAKRRLEAIDTSPKGADWVYDLIRDYQSSGVYSTRPNRSLEDNADITKQATDPTRLTELSVPLSDVEFPASSLATLQVLRQVDRKFIPCILEGKSGDTRYKVLVIFDQHAADERAAVESILDELCDGFAKQNLATTQLEEGHVRLVLTRREVEILERPGSRDILKRWGIDLAPDITTGEYIQVSVLSVPSLLERLSNKKGTELTRLLKLYLPVLDEDLGEIQALIESLNDSQESWARIQRWMPREMVELANSKACRGAIMFEDKLNHDQSTRLLSRLADTRNPWVCAHGRPTFVPLCVLPSNRKNKNSKRINWTTWQQKNT